MPEHKRSQYAESDPRSVRVARVGAWMGYLVVNVGFCVWLWTLPASSLASDGSTDGGVAFALVFWVVASLVAYRTVQGSNPGYVDSETLNNAEAEARGLLSQPPAIGMSAVMIDDDDDDEDDNDGKRQSSQAGQGQAAAATRERASMRPAEAASVPGPAASHDAGGDIAASDRGRREPPTLAELGMTEEELEAAVDAEMERRLGKPASWLEDEALEAKGPAPPPRAGVPVRAHFCKVSRRYVHMFDHYCGFLGTPIGERNHCRFWWFLLAQTCAICTALGISHSAFRFASTTSGWWALNGSPFFLCFVLYLLLLFVGGLFMMHTWLALTGATSYEMLKGPRRVWYLRHTRPCDYPFSKGPVANLRRFCCSTDAACSGLYGKDWRPSTWVVPDRIVRDSDDVMEHCWENRYWSCC